MSSSIGQMTASTAVPQTAEMIPSANESRTASSVGGHQVTAASPKVFAGDDKVAKAFDDSAAPGQKGTRLESRKIAAASSNAADAKGDSPAQTFDRFVEGACDFGRLEADMRAKRLEPEQLTAVKDMCAEAGKKIRMVVADARAKNGLDPKGKGDWAKLDDEQLAGLRDRIVDIVCTVTHDVAEGTCRLARPREMPQHEKPAAGQPVTKPPATRPPKKPLVKQPAAEHPGAAESVERASAPIRYEKGMVCGQGRNACYMMSVVNSLLQTDAGTELLNDICPNPDHPDSYLFRISEDVVKEAERDQKVVEDSLAQGKDTYGKNDLQAAKRRLTELRQFRENGIWISRKSVAAKQAQLKKVKPPLGYSSIEVAIHLGEEVIAGMGSWYRDGTSEKPNVPAYGEMGSCVSVAMLLGLRNRYDQDPLKVVEDGGFAILRKGVVGNLNGQGVDAGHYQAIVGKSVFDPDDKNRFLVADSLSESYEEAMAVRLQDEPNQDMVEDQVFCYALDPNWRRQWASLKNAKA